AALLNRRAPGRGGRSLYGDRQRPQLERFVVDGLVLRRIEFSQRQTLGDALENLRRLAPSVRNECNAADPLLSSLQSQSRGCAPRAIDREIGRGSNPDRGKAASAIAPVRNRGENRLV